jgi:SET domain-containing protein
VNSIALLHPAIVIAKTKKKGRGVFTTAFIKAKTVIEIAPVIVMDPHDRPLLDQTLLHNYIFEWGENKAQCGMALGYVPLYNHAFESNCEYEMDFKKDIISIKTVRNIEAGEELYINYNGDWNNASPLWFAVK